MAPKKRTTGASDPHVLAEIGSRLARLRLHRNLTQDQLAREAGIGKRTLLRLEQGRSSQLTNFVRVLRALQLLDGLVALVPASSSSPLTQLATRQPERRRASTKSKPRVPKTAWTWGDEPPTRGTP